VLYLLAFRCASLQSGGIDAAVSGNMMADDLTHLDSGGQARMVDVGEKPVTRERL
jgi:hypothetical protein